MNILVLQETDWLTRGPHIQHHIFERLSTIPSIKVTIIDYDIDKKINSKSRIIKRKVYENVSRTIKKSNIKIIRTGHIQVPYLRRISSMLTNFVEILKIIRKNKPDVIIAYSLTNGILGLTLAKLFKIPYIFHYIDILHQLIPIKSVQGIAKIITRVIFKFSDRILVYTLLHQARIIKEGADPDKVSILPNGISLENTIVDEKKFLELKKQISITDDDFVIFFMGYLYDFAGLKEIIDYYDPYNKTGKLKLKFLILGDGGIINEIRNHIKKTQADWVFLVGRVSYFEITEYIQLADLCLLSFKKNEITNEITPIKIIEYMAMKKPVLSNSLPGLVLEIGKNNGVIFAENQNELIKMIGTLVNQRDILKGIGLRGYSLVKEKYTWQKVIKQFKQIIINVMNQ